MPNDPLVYVAAGLLVLLLGLLVKELLWPPPRRGGGVGPKPHGPVRKK